jgi:hypothetical protein
MPAEVISTDAVHVDNAIIPDYVTSQVAHMEPVIGSTEPNIPIDHNCTDDKLQFGMAGCWEEYKNEGDKINQVDAIPTARWRCRATTQLDIFNLGTSDVDRHDGNDGDDADVDEPEEASPADDGLMQHLHD